MRIDNKFLLAWLVMRNKDRITARGITSTKRLSESLFNAVRRVNYRGDDHMIFNRRAIPEGKNRRIATRNHQAGVNWTRINY